MTVIGGITRKDRVQVESRPTHKKDKANCHLWASRYKALSVFIRVHLWLIKSSERQIRWNFHLWASGHKVLSMFIRVYLWLIKSSERQIRWNFHLWASGHKVLSVFICG